MIGFIVLLMVCFILIFLNVQKFYYHKKKIIILKIISKHRVNIIIFFTPNEILLQCEGQVQIN